MHVQQIWHFPDSNAKELLQVVYYSCTGPQTEQVLLAYVNKYYTFSAAKPAKLFSGELSGGAYHYGDVFSIYVKGLPDSVLDHCSMSEGEREKATLEYLRLTGLGLTVMAFAKASAKAATTIPRLTFVGYLALAD